MQAACLVGMQLMCAPKMQLLLLYQADPLPVAPAARLVQAPTVRLCHRRYTIEGTKDAPGVMPRALVDLFAGLATHVEPLVARASYYEVGGRSGSPCAVQDANHGARVVCRRVAGEQALPSVVLLAVASFVPARWHTPLLQVYNEQIYDLLDEQGVGPLGHRAALRLKEDMLGRVFVAGLSEVRRMQRGCLCACCAHVTDVHVSCAPQHAQLSRYFQARSSCPVSYCAGAGGGVQCGRGAGPAAARLPAAPARRDRPQLLLLPLPLHLHGAVGFLWD